MDKKDLRDPVMAEFAKHHQILAERLIRDDRTGCLEYLGPPGRYSGNPVLHIDHGRTSIHLRRYIWIQAPNDPKCIAWPVCKNKMKSFG